MSNNLKISLGLNLMLILVITALIFGKDRVNIFSAKSTKRKPVSKNAPAPDKPFWYFRNYDLWKERKTLFELLPTGQNEIIFLGNSLTDRCEWDELFDAPNIKNRGIDGDNTEGILERLSQVTKGNPAKIFLNAGINDIALKYTIEQITNNYISILERIEEETPETKLYVQSVIPTFKNSTRGNDRIQELNSALQSICEERDLVYIDLFNEFIDADGKLDASFSYDGVHLNGKGYMRWKRVLEEYVKE